jgi:NTP pyrophosphatase (non-canonical NTP hydrolase)
MEGDLMDLGIFQKEMASRFRKFDKKSGPFFLMAVLTGEVGELAESVKDDQRERIAEELADVIFAAVSIANIYDIDLPSALEKKHLNRTIRGVSKNWDEPYLEGRVDELRKKQ